MQSERQSERRVYPRRPIIRPATIKLEQGREITCMLRNISKAGALISLENDFELPPHFILDMSGNIVVQRPCELVWQSERMAGLKFPVLKGFQAVQFNLY